MFFNVMGVFLIYTLVFLLFKNYDPIFLTPNNDTDDVHLFIFCGIFMIGLAWIMYYYAKRMNKRISHEQRKKETLMRRELTQNISHELKTPVASILGFTETILENPTMPEDTKRLFIARTNSQAQRLASLLQDLSMLNRMDYAAKDLPVERVNVSNIVSEIIQDIELDLNKKNMFSKNYLPENILIKGNTSMIYSIFRNLFENAINYAGNGSIIEISAEEQSDRWHFRFCDNGQGIPSEHLTRIFERFYRIDKGRSRVLGGTGLGLSIIKNSVLLHGGKITASSAENGGLCFDFTLKKMIKSF